MEPIIERGKGAHWDREGLKKRKEVGVGKKWKINGK